MPIISHSIFLFLGYWVASTIEWMVHNYCMHALNTGKVPTTALKNINKQHLIHHAATKTDMTIVPTVDKYKKNNLPMKYQRFQGLYFVWPVNIAIFIGFIIGGPIVNFILSNTLPFNYSVSYLSTIIYSLLIALYMNLMWNYVHPTLHFQPGLSINEGLDLIPRQEWIENTSFYNWLWQNHVLHHFLSGSNAGNYNVTLPGADWLYGTYHSECDGYKLDVKNKKIYKLK